MAAGPIAERNQDATIYVGGLDDKVSETLMWELFVQAGPVVNVHMPKDRVTQMHQGYGFVEFMGEEDADYAIKVLNMIKLYGKPIRVNKASAHQKNLDVGANIFIGNLDPEVDEKLLYDTFSAFGVILQTPKIMRDPETGNSKGFAFINFASFEASDSAIEAMNGQYLCNRPISVSYAFKKDAKGERHGSAAERLLAAQNPLSQADRPHQLFADAPPTAPLPPPPGAMPPPPPMTPMGMAMMPPPPPSLGNMFPPPPPPVPPPNSMGMMQGIPPPPLPPSGGMQPPPLPPPGVPPPPPSMGGQPPLPPLPPTNGQANSMMPGMGAPPLPPGMPRPPQGPPPMRPPGSAAGQPGAPPPPRMMPPPWQGQGNGYPMQQPYGQGQYPQGPHGWRPPPPGRPPFGRPPFPPRGPPPPPRGMRPPPPDGSWEESGGYDESGSYDYGSY
ncbi:hypothetical protein FOCC_FOCC015856 [Frankliniella occidentalis]|uniref:Splicing factor 3B subunit 4 n=1 Tax=Frankliniella occidentalis TaxID=133901 RepID=A0A6J1TKY6_FRAOC|nr:splicing factor 3B subunit 4 [Frankliniella occidentalis]KAE8738654.1 hypothetical protein FOCC_FOCC015856 [Frankliniella occidentalis]